MKRILYILLALFLIIDAFIAFKLFRPSVSTDISSTKRDRSIEVRSSNLTKIPHLQNTAYLNKKLNEAGFWKTKNVNYFVGNIEKVTVNHLIIEITDKPQLWGGQLNNFQEKKVILSYGQSYYAPSQTMTIYVHVIPEFFSGESIETVYGSALLQSIFDLTYKYPKSQKDYSSGMVKFASDYYENPENQKIIRFGFL